MREAVDVHAAEPLIGALARVVKAADELTGGSMYADVSEKVADAIDAQVPVLQEQLRLIRRRSLIRPTA